MNLRFNGKASITPIKDTTNSQIINCHQGMMVPVTTITAAKLEYNGLTT